MSNVFKFPENKIVREVQPSVEEIEKAKEKGKIKYADAMIAEISLGLCDELENYGIDLSDDDGEMSKDFIFLTDVLKSVVYRNMGIEHSLHKFIDENVAVFTNEKEYREYLEKAETDSSEN
jgi:hypothetical protein